MKHKLLATDNMKTKFLIIYTCLIALMASCTDNSREKAAKTDPKPTYSLFPTGKEITNSNFKGKAYLQSLIEADSLNQIAVGNVTFEAGSRTNWHSHPGGQILLATAGTGYYQEKGSPIKILHRGDAIKCPPNVVHWHGASPDDMFAQVAITTRQAGPPVWLQPVTDEEYQAK